MQLEVAHGFLEVDVVRALIEVLAREAEREHHVAHLLGVFCVKEDIVVRHLSHPVAGIQSLEHAALERHVPDARGVHQ